MQNKPEIPFKFSDLFSKNYRIITIILLLLPPLIYWQVWNFEFVWDDDDGVGMGHLHNPFVKNPSMANFFELFSQPYYGMFIPITYLFWGGLKAFSEVLGLPLNSVLHFTNVIIHIVNGLLVFTILKNFVANKWAVLLGTLFFLLHPIQAEVVAWVSEFRSLLAFCFSLSALYFYLKNQAKPNILSLLFFLLALLSKPSAVVLPLLIFIINHFHYGLKIKDNIITTAYFAPIAIIVVVITNLIQITYNADFAAVASVYFHTIFAWLDSIIFYLYQLIFPYHLSPSYALSLEFISAKWWFYPLSILPIGLGIWLWRWRKTQPLLLLSGALFVAGFFTTSGFVSFAFQTYSLVADRYLYFAMLGFALFIAVIFSKINNKNWQLVMIFALLIFAGISAFRQIPIWQNALKLWSHAVNYESQPKYAHENLAVAFHNKATNSKNPQQAIAYFNKAIEYYPKYSADKLNDTIYTRDTTRLLNFNNQATNLIAKGELKLALKTINQALEIYAKQAKTDGNIISEIYYNQGRIYLRQQQAKLAENAFTKAINLGIKTENQQEYSDFFYNRGVAKAQQNLLPAAIDDFAKTIELNPENAKVRNDKIYSHLLLKQCQKAQADANLARQNQIKLQAAILAKLKQQCK